MAAVQYSPNSVYARTQTNGNYLDIATLPVMPMSANDVVFKINTIYQYRPDLLAYDLYGDAGWWWVFALRNPNVIKDPIFDMRAGRSIFLPKKENLSVLLK